MPMFSPIAGAIRPPEVEDLATAQARQQALRSQMQQAQLGGIQLQNAVRDQNDEKITRQAFMDSGGDFTKAMALMAQRGGSPKAIQAMATAQLKNRETQSTIDKNTGQGKAATAKALEDQHAMVGDALESVRSQAPEDRPAAWATAVSKLKSEGNWHPGDNEAYPGDQQLNQMADSMLGSAKVLAKQKEARDAAAQQITTSLAVDKGAREAAIAPAQQAEATAKATTAGVQADQMSTLGMTAEQKQNLERQTAANAETARHNKRDEGLRGATVSLEQKRFNATLGSGLDANGRPLSTDEAKTEAMKDPIAVAIAGNKMLPPKSLTDRNGAGQAMMRRVLAINPSYDVAQAPARLKTEADFAASGASGKQITTADTALAHLDRLSRAGMALKNGNVSILNSIANEVGAQTGASAPKVYDSILAMVAPEVSKAVIGAAGGEGERQAMAKNFSRDSSDAAREGAIGAAAGLLAERVHKQASAYESTMGHPLARQLSPESQAVMQRYSKPAASGATVRVVSPDGTPGKIPADKLDEALKRGFKKAGQ